MENNELIERYIYAVSKHLPANIKKDVADELNSIIQDMLEERCGDILPTEHDVKVVLTELGTPRELALKYNEDRDKCLIGAPYYTTYKYTLKLVCACVLFGMPIATIMGGLTSQDSEITILTDTISGIVSGLLSAFTYVTILFSIFYHKGIKMDNLYDSIDKLPPVPKQTKIIPKREPIWGIGISVIFAIVFIGFPQIVFVMISDRGITVPVFNVQYIRATWYFVILFSMLGIVRECVKLIDGSYTRRLMIVTIVTDIFTGILSCIWLTNENILNPEFKTTMMSLFENDGAFIGRTFNEFNIIFLLIILFALLLDVATTVFRTMKD